MPTLLMALILAIWAYLCIFDYLGPRNFLWDSAHWLPLSLRV